MTEEQERKSFLEVQENELCVVVLGDTRCALGHVKTIYASHPLYLIWEDDVGKVWYEIDRSNLTLPTEFHDFWVRWQALMSEPQHNLNAQQIGLYKNILAASLSSALENAFGSAGTALDSAATFLHDANERVSKGRYVKGVLVTVVGALLFSFILSRWGNLHVGGIGWLAMLALTGGAVGTFLSSLTGKIVDARFDPNATAREGYMNGIIRVLYGLCGAFVVVAAIRSGVISSDLITESNEVLVLLCLAIAGGFSERQAANILNRLQTGEKRERHSRAGSSAESDKSPNGQAHDKQLQRTEKTADN